MPEFPPPSPLPNGYQPPTAIAPVPPPPDPIDLAQKAVLSRIRELIVLLAEKEDQRSLVGLRQWAKLMTEARRIAKNRKPRVGGIVEANNGGAIGAYFGGDAIDDVNADDDEDGMGHRVYNPIGGLGDQGNLLRGMVGELQAMGGATSAQNEAREIDAMVGAVRMLAHVKGTSNKKRAAGMEQRLLDIVDKKLEAMEERYVKPPSGVLPAGDRPLDPRATALQGALPQLPAPVPRRARRRAR